MRKDIVVFTGAGVSKESGISTFRDNDGHWEEFDFMEVASYSGWLKDPAKVLDFYNRRMNQYKDVKPNHAHELIAELEKHHDVTVITQNVDNLHEKAGSSKIFHLHGTMDLRSEDVYGVTYPYDRDIKIGDLAPDGGQLRPNVVWFGERLDEDVMYHAEYALRQADICIIIGTSLSVTPASQLPEMVKAHCKVYYIDPNASYNHCNKSYTLIQDVATVGMEQIFNLITEQE